MTKLDYVPANLSQSKLMVMYSIPFFVSSEVGETPLHKAAQTSSVAVVKLLLNEGADVNPKTDAKVKKVYGLKVLI